MIVKVFSIWDEKVKAFRFPFFAQSTGQAIRMFMEASNDLKTEIGKYPQDFTLFEHGEFDDESGSLFQEKTPVSLGLALVFVENKKEEVDA